MLFLKSDCKELRLLSLGGEGNQGNAESMPDCECV